MEATIFFGIIYFFAIAFCAVCIYVIIDITAEWLEDRKEQKEFAEYWKATESEREEQSNKIKNQMLRNLQPNGPEIFKKISYSRSQRGGHIKRQEGRLHDISNPIPPGWEAPQTGK